MAVITGKAAFLWQALVNMSILHVQQVDCMMRSRLRYRLSVR